MRRENEIVSDGGASLVDVISSYEADGYGAQMLAREGGVLLCSACREESSACDVGLDALRRLEGASDPAEMSAVAALSCPKCGAKGTSVLRFGPEAPAEDDEVLRLLDDRRTSADGGTATS